MIVKLNWDTDILPKFVHLMSYVNSLWHQLFPKSFRCLKLYTSLFLSLVLSFNRKAIKLATSTSNNNDYCDEDDDNHASDVSVNSRTILTGS